MTADPLRAQGEVAVPPIEHDASCDRDYIPLPGGWEIQTKGTGSTFRICDPQGERLAVPSSPYLHETLTRMAREIHAACSSHPPVASEDAECAGGEGVGS